MAGRRARQCKKGRAPDANLRAEPQSLAANSLLEFASGQRPESPIFKPGQVPEPSRDYHGQKPHVAPEHVQSGVE